MPPHEHLLLDTVETPLGPLRLACDGRGKLRALHFADDEARLTRLLDARHGPGRHSTTRARDPFGVSSSLAAYFDGEIAAIERLDVDAGGTSFQALVWAELRRIPAGSTLSYGALARRLGRPAAARAVGLANNRNPIGIVVPCHRVIGADGSLTGYAGGLERKRFLLEHEARHAAFGLFSPRHPGAVSSGAVRS